MPVASTGDTATNRRTITEDDIQQFATLTGDDNPLHLDPEYGAETMFTSNVAHGILTAGIVSGALAALPGDVIYLEQEMRFQAPVFPGETVEATASVVESLDEHRIRVDVEAVVVERDETALVGEAVVLSVPHD